MTPYPVLANSNTDKSQFEYSGFKLKRLWFVGRHGARFPEEKTLQGMFSVLPMIKQEILKNGSKNPCYSDKLESWLPWSKMNGSRSPDVETIDSVEGTYLPFFELIPEPEKGPTGTDQVPCLRFVKSLTLQGRSTMAALGERFRLRFGDLIPSELDSKTEIYFTSTARTRESAIRFASGLFGDIPPDDSPQLRQVEKFDKVLKFDSSCFYWKYKVKKSPNMSKICEDYETGDEMKRTVEKVKNRCLLENLERSHLMHIYRTCSYELSWYDESLWCDFLDEEDLEVLEYDEDLKLFNQCAYGHEMNYRIACPMLIDMFDFLTKPKETRARFSFTHAKTLIKFSARLGLFNESKKMLTAFNYESKSQREWASSKYAGFSFNFTFLLYESESTGERAILMMLNEQLTKIPGCETIADTDLCPVEKFEEMFKDSIYKCDYEEWCHTKDQERLHKEYLQEVKSRKKSSTSSSKSGKSRSKELRREEDPCT